MLQEGLYPWLWFDLECIVLIIFLPIVSLLFYRLGKWNGILEKHICASHTPWGSLYSYTCGLISGNVLTSSELVWPLKARYLCDEQRQEQWNTGACGCGKRADLRSSSFLGNTLEMWCLWNALLKILLYFVLKARFLSGGLEQFLLCLELTFHWTMQMERKWKNTDWEWEWVFCVILGTRETLYVAKIITVDIYA